MSEDCAYSACGTLWIAANEEEMAEAERKQLRLREHGIESRVLDAGALARAEPALRKGLTGALEDYYASPIGVDGKIYIASEHGKVVVLRAAGEWQILAINEFDSDIYATPAVSEGRMYIRTRNALYAIGSGAGGR